MRLSTNMIFDQQVRGISDAQSSWLKAGSQLSTGRRVTNPSDDPIAASRAVVLAQTQQQDSQFALARTFADQGLSLEESVLGNVTTVISSAQSIVVSAGNGSLSDDDRASYATQLEGIRSQLLNLANSKDGNGRYIFAGYQTDKPPFKEDASSAVQYVGGDTAITQKVDSERTMTVGHTGDSIFNQLTSNATPEPSGSSETNIFTTLDNAIAALKTPQTDADETTQQNYSAAIDKANRGLSNSLNNVLAVRSEIGTQLDELENTLNPQGDDRKVILKNQMSALVDVDYTSAISTYTMQQQALQASYTTFTDMSKMSLFQLNS